MIPYIDPYLLMSTADFSADLTGDDRTVPLLSEIQRRDYKRDTRGRCKIKLPLLLMSFLIGYGVQRNAVRATSRCECPKQA